MLKVLRKVFRITWFWGAFACLGPAAFEKQNDFNDSKASDEERDVYQGRPSFEDLETQHRLCKNTYGRWHGLRLTCQCPKNQLFSTADGCQLIPVSSAVLEKFGKFSSLSSKELQETVLNFLDLHGLTVKVSLEGLTSSETLHVADMLDENLAGILSGVSLPPPDVTSKTILKLVKTSHDDFNPKDFYLTYWSPNRESLDPPGLHFISSELLVTPFLKFADLHQKNIFFLKCSGVLKQHASDLDPKAIQDLCSTLPEALKRVNADFKSWEGTLHVTQTEQGCRSGCAMVGNTKLEGVPVLYTVTMQGYAPVSRIIQLATAYNAAVLLVFLSPQGSVEGIILKYHTLEDSNSHAMIHSTRMVYNYLWTPLGKDVKRRGDRASISMHLEGLRRVQNNVATDTPQRVKLFYPIHASLIDTAVDVRIPGLRHRLNIPLGSRLEDLAGVGMPFLIHRGQPVLECMDLLDDDPWEGQHGTKIAAVMVSDLPNARLNFIQYRDIDFFSAGSDVAAWWIRHITANGSRVVNISVDYARSIADCEAFFGRIFDALPDVLFVVGVGNKGAYHPMGVCPAGIAKNRGHVLTVAGSDASGMHLEAESNYGKNIAKVAAPYRGYSVAVGGSTVPPPQGIVSMAGTSYSAAWVSNAAMRWIARYPSASAVDVADALQKQCYPSQLEVACGGTIGIHTLEPDE